MASQQEALALTEYWYRTVKTQYSLEFCLFWWVLLQETLWSATIGEILSVDFYATFDRAVLIVFEQRIKTATIVF